MVKTYSTEYAYQGNTKIHVFKENGVEAYSKIVNDYDVSGYCSCLEDMGYNKKEKKSAKRRYRVCKGHC